MKNIKFVSFVTINSYNFETILLIGSTVSNNIINSSFVEKFFQKPVCFQGNFFSKLKYFNILKLYIYS